MLSYTGLLLAHVTMTSCHQSQCLPWLAAARHDLLQCTCQCCCKANHPQIHVYVFTDDSTDHTTYGFLKGRDHTAQLHCHSGRSDLQTRLEQTAAAAPLSTDVSRSAVTSLTCS